MPPIPDAATVIFLVDGMRPDGLRQASTPVMDALIASGASTFAARTVMPSVTFPCVFAMLTGSVPRRTGTETPGWSRRDCDVPDILTAARQAKRSTAMFYNWGGLHDACLPGGVETCVFMDNWGRDGGDAELTGMVVQHLSTARPDLMFVYYGFVDMAGHAYGYMSEKYLAAIAAVDGCIGRVVDKLPAGRTVAVTADHGGHDNTHGWNIDADMTIPVIFNGPGVPAGVTIPGPVSITDVAPTALSLMGVDIPPQWTGRPIDFAARH